MVLDMILMIKKNHQKIVFFSYRKNVGEKYFRTEKIFFRKPKKSKIFIENQYKNFRKKVEKS